MPSSTELVELSKGILNEVNYFYFRVGGNNSMHPLLKRDDIVGVIKADIHNIKFGDIVVYHHLSSELVAHRLIKIKKKNDRKLFITKADVSNFYDEPISHTEIIGKIINIRRGEKDIRLDTNSVKVKTIVYTVNLIIRRWLFLIIPRTIKETIRHRMLGGILLKVQGFETYAYIMKRILGKRISYRIATQEDLASIARLHRVYFWPLPLEAIIKNLNEYLLEKDEGNPKYCFLAQIGNRVIGTICIGKLPEFESKWRGEKLFVDWRYRRIGIATELVKLAMNKAIENEVFEVKTGFSEKYIPFLIKIYQKLDLFQYYSVSFLESDTNSKKTADKRFILVTLTKK